MRILYVSDAASIHTRRWAEAFRDAGDEVHVASFRPSDIAGVIVHRLPTLGLGKAGYLAAVPVLHKLAKRIRPDVVHAQYVTSYGFVAAAARLKPLVVTAWGTDVLISPQESLLSRRLAERALKAADRITTVAEHMNPAVLALGVHSSKLMALPFGVDTSLFRPPSIPVAPDPPLRVISTRNFGPVYSVHTVIDAVRQLVQKGHDVQLELVGTGPLLPELEERARHPALKGRVTFHGAVDHQRLVSLLGAAHVFVSSALSDGNNVSLNEAMACACFPITTDIPANAQWIEHGRNGMLFAAGDSKQLAACVESAAGNSVLRANAGVLNRRIVEQRADWRTGVKLMRDVYKQVISGQRHE
jgi:glycosyltransferase involved in cell wall biosynthesis